MGDIKPHSNREYLAFFKSRLSTLSQETAYKYRSTISEIDLFLTGHHLLLSSLNSTMVADFTIDLLRRGLAKNTVIRHLNIFNSLVKSASKAEMLLPSNAPREMARVLTAAVGELPPLMREQTFDGLLHTLRMELRGKGVRDVYTDILLFSLLNGAMPLRKVVMLKKEDVKGCNEASAYIAERNLSRERKYVFDLKQSYLTPKQLYKTVEKEWQSKYGQYALGSERFDADNLTRSLWVALAIKSGATASEALACQPDGAPYALPSFCDSAYSLSHIFSGASGSSENADTLRAEGEETKHDEVKKSLWNRSVVTMLTSDLPRWYAMHLRKGVSYDEVRRELSEGIRPVPELFYPSETIRKRIGSRTVVDDKPFISSTVFFKTYPERIVPMFNRIGDKAWCYRVTRGAGSPYAVISSKDMGRFQSVIGIFTPDIEIHPLGELIPKPGESVIVIKAGYSNRQGEVEEVINTESGSAIFRVKLSTDQGYEWRVDLDAHQIERLR